MELPAENRQISLEMKNEPLGSALKQFSNVFDLGWFSDLNHQLFFPVDFHRLASSAFEAVVRASKSAILPGAISFVS